MLPGLRGPDAGQGSQDEEAAGVCVVCPRHEGAPQAGEGPGTHRLRLLHGQWSVESSWQDSLNL